MKKSYESLQKEIDKILYATSKKKTGKTYNKMMRDEKFKSSIKKIAKLMMELEEIEEKSSNNKRYKINT